MATGGITVESVLGKISREHLECSICADNFRDPKVLDCLHTFCLKCLREIRKQQDPQDKKLVCPICRKQTKMEGIEVGDLPHNFTLDALVDELQMHLKLLGTEPSHVTCQSCEEEDQTAVSRCMDCDHFLCEECKRAHGRLAITRSHTICTIDQFRSGDVVYKSKLREHVPKCQTHLDQSLSIYCTTCEQMTCTTCSILNHGNHSFVAIQEAYDSFKQQVAGLVSEAKDKIKEFRVAMDTANALHKKLDSIFADTTKKVSQKADKEIAKIKEEEQKLQQESEKMYKEKSEPLKMYAAKSSNEATQSEQKLADVTNLMAETNCYEVLNLKNKVLFNLRDLTEKKPTIAAEHSSFFDFVEGDSLGVLGKLVVEDQTILAPQPKPRTQLQPQPPSQSSTCTVKNEVTKHVGNVPLQTSVIGKGRWELKTELQNQFKDVCSVGVYSNNRIIALDSDDGTISAFFPLHKSKREFKVILSGIEFERLTVTSKDRIVALDDPSVVVLLGVNENLRFQPGKGPNINPKGIAVNKDNIIAVSYEDRGKISLHTPDGVFIRMLQARGADEYLTFYKNQLIYTISDSDKLISIDYSTGETVFEVDVDDDDDDLETTGVCCDLDGSIYVASQKYNGEIRHFSPTGEYMELAIKGCGSAREILITPGGELVVAAGDTLKVYHRV